MLILVKNKTNYFDHFFDILYELFFKILPCTLTIKDNVGLKTCITLPYLTSLKPILHKNTPSRLGLN